MFLNKIVLFLKQNWLLILAITGAIFLSFHIFKIIDSIGNDTSRLEKKIQEQSERHMNDLAEMSRIMREQQERQVEIENEFRQKVEELNKKYQQKVNNVNRNQQANQKRLVENPSAISQEFRNVFGIRSYQP